MPYRTWEPGLVLVLKKSAHYMTKWQPQLSANLTTDQYACFLTTLSAIQACIKLLVGT